MQFKLISPQKELFAELEHLSEAFPTAKDLTKTSFLPDLCEKLEPRSLLLFKLIVCEINDPLDVLVEASSDRLVDGELLQPGSHLGATSCPSALLLHDSSVSLSQDSCRVLEEKLLSLKVESNNAEAFSFALLDSNRNGRNLASSSEAQSQLGAQSHTGSTLEDDNPLTDVTDCREVCFVQLQ